MKLKKLSILMALIIMSTFFISCSRTDALKVKIGLKNNDFEYIKEDKVKKIVIQSTRDKGFTFIVTDKEAIKELYDILSTAKEVEKKSSLKPDYIFEMYEKGDVVHQFQYIAGLDKKDYGNLYSEDKVYIVSSRLDNDIIKNFWNIRKPKEFQSMYYESLYKVLNRYRKFSSTAQDEYADKSGTKSIGIDISDDLDVSKFILSTDLENFSSVLKEEFSNVELKKENKQYDVLMKVDTEGYKSTVYKAIITFNVSENVKEKKFYVWGKYEKNTWNISVYEDEKPEGF